MIGFLQLFIIGFGVSFIGSIPPGIINLTVMQLGIKNQVKAAYQYIVGVAVVEFGYAFIAVRFSEFIKSNESIGRHLDLLAAFVLVAFGIGNLMSKYGARKAKQDSRLTFFIKGALVSLLNPLAITFWLGVTTYLLSSNLILFSGYNYMLYLSGIVLGTMLLLVLVANMSKRFKKLQDNKFIVYSLPGIVFIIMGIYSFLNWLETTGLLSK